MNEKESDNTWKNISVDEPHKCEHEKPRDCPLYWDLLTHIRDVVVHMQETFYTHRDRMAIVLGLDEYVIVSQHEKRIVARIDDIEVWPQSIESYLDVTLKQEKLR